MALIRRHVLTKDSVHESELIGGRGGGLRGGSDDSVARQYKSVISIKTCDT
jgi:hypothetical protein